MTKTKAALTIMAIATVASTSASSSNVDPAVALSNCVTSKATDQDKLDLARWIGASLASTSALNGIAKVDPVARDKADRTMGALFTRLFAKDCAREAKIAMKANQAETFRLAGERLGQIAMEHLIQNGDGGEQLGSYVKYIDMTQFAKLMY